jgi:thiamine transport system substrate-binding protein
MRHTILAAGLTLVAGGAMAQVPVLTVYTYDSFIPEWGPGPAIEAAFEETCGCDLQFVGRATGRLCCRASGWRARGRRRMSCWGSTPT